MAAVIEEDDLYSYRRDYVPPSSASRLAASVSSRRFGHTRDFTVLFDSTNTDAQNDYITGLIIAGSLTLIVFLVWGIALLVFKCLGQRRVGFLSGHAYVRQGDGNGDGDSKGSGQDASATSREEEPPAVPQHDLHFESNHQTLPASSSSTSSSSYRPSGGAGGTNEPSQSQAGRRTTTTTKPSCWRRTRHDLIGRTIFLISSTIFIIFSCLLVANGVTNLQTTVTQINQSASQVNSLATELQSVHTNTLDMLSNDGVVTLRDTLVQEFGNDQQLCPADPTMDASSFARDLKENADQARTLLDSLGDFLEDDTADLVELVDQIGTASAELDERTSVQFANTVSIILLVFYVTIPLIFIVGTTCAVLSGDEWAFSCIMDWLILPIFIIMVMTAFGVHGAMTIAAGINTDFCLPGGRVDTTATLATGGGMTAAMTNANANNNPDATIMSIVETVGYTPQTYVYQGIDWFITQCDTTVATNPFQPLVDYTPTVEANVAVVQQLQNLFADPSLLQELSQECGRDFTALRDDVDTLGTLINALVDTLKLTLQLFDCDNIVTLYTDTIYDGTCTYSVDAVYWVYACAMVLGVFGMLMITFRASYRPTMTRQQLFEEQQEQEQRKNGNNSDDDDDETRSGDDAAAVAADQQKGPSYADRMGIDLNGL